MIDDQATGNRKDGGDEGKPVYVELPKDDPEEAFRLLKEELERQSEDDAEK